MTTLRIEETVEEFIFEFSDHITANTPWGVKQVEDQMRDCLTKALTQLRQETLDEAVEIIKKELRNAPLEVQMTKGVFFGKVIKALQDNK